MSSIQNLDKIIQMRGNAPNEWKNILNQISNNQNECYNFLSILNTRINNFGKDNQILLLDIIDYLVDNGNYTILSQISSKEFLKNLLDVLKKTDDDVQFKILGLIQKWGTQFQNQQSSYQNFIELYQNLLKAGVGFPNNYTSTYQNYLNNNINYSNEYEQDFNNNYNNNGYNEDKNEYDYVGSIGKILVPNKFEKKYHKLVKFLKNMCENISLVNEMMDNNETDALSEVLSPLRNGNNTLIETISGDKLKDEKLMEITIAIVDDIEKTMKRYEKIREGKNPGSFNSSFMGKNIGGIVLKKKQRENYINNNNNNRGYYEDNYRDNNYNNNNYINNYNNNYNNDNNYNNNNNNNGGYNNYEQKGSRIEQFNNIKPDPNIKNVNDLFDVFSAPVVEQPSNNNMNINIMNNNNMGNNNINMNNNMNMNNNINMNNNMGMNNNNNVMFQQQQKPIDKTQELQENLKKLFVEQNQYNEQNYNNYMGNIQDNNNMNMMMNMNNNNNINNNTNNNMMINNNMNEPNNMNNTNINNMMMNNNIYNTNESKNMMNYNMNANNMMNNNNFDNQQNMQMNNNNNNQNMNNNNYNNNNNYMNSMQQSTATINYPNFGNSSFSMSNNQFSNMNNMNNNNNMNNQIYNNNMINQQQENYLNPQQQNNLNNINNLF